MWNMNFISLVHWWQFWCFFLHIDGNFGVFSSTLMAILVFFPPHWWQFCCFFLHIDGNFGVFSSTLMAILVIFPPHWWQFWCFSSTLMAIFFPHRARSSTCTSVTSVTWFPTTVSRPLSPDWCGSPTCGSRLTTPRMARASEMRCSTTSLDCCTCLSSIFLSTINTQKWVNDQFFKFYFEQLELNSLIFQFRKASL